MIDDTDWIDMPQDEEPTRIVPADEMARIIWEALQTAEEECTE